MRSQSAMVTNMEQGADRVVLTYCFQRNNQETGQTALAALNMFTKQLAEQVLKLLPILLSRYKQLSAEGGFTWSGLTSLVCSVTCSSIQQETQYTS